MLEHRNFVKKLVFAVETLPVNLVVAGLVTELFAIMLYCVFLLADQSPRCRGALLWLPVLLIPQILFTAGVSWFLAALGRVRARPGPDHRLRADALVLPDAHLLSGEQAAPRRGGRADEESDLRAGARLSRRSSCRTRRPHSARCGSCGWCRWWCSCWATRGSTNCASRFRICCEEPRAATRWAVRPGSRGRDWSRRHPCR